LIALYATPLRAATVKPSNRITPVCPAGVASLFPIPRFPQNPSKVGCAGASPTGIIAKLMLKVCAGLLLLVAAVSAPAQTNFFQSWSRRASATQARQPAWTPPLVTTFVPLIQVYRGDFTRQIGSTHTTTWNYDGSKGLNLIPWANTEFDFDLPPLLTHSNPATVDGAGDLSFQGKYRILTGNARHGNYAVSAFVTATVPTGSYKNGSTDATVAPAMGLGKGFGAFDVQSTLSATLPTGDTTKLGRPVTWNTAAQFHLAKYFWPETEVNATYFHGGPNDGRTQAFLTPGLLAARKLRPSSKKSRLGLCVGAGEQIAVSSFHSYNHELIFTGRLVF
jgi:hypothetical protein